MSALAGETWKVNDTPDTGAEHGPGDAPTPIANAVSRCIAELGAALVQHRDALATITVDRTGLAAQLAEAEAALSEAPRGGDHARVVGAAVEGLRVRLRAADQVAEIATRAAADCERTRDILLAASPHDASDQDAADGPAGQGGSRQLFQVVENERMRIARDMHDGPAQHLSNLVLKAEIVERFLEHDPAMVRSELEDFKAIVRIALEETRQLIFDLRPMSLDDLGLVPTVRRFAADLESRWNLPIHVHVIGMERRIERDREAAIFRIVQEAVNNARRHAMASQITVTLSLSPTRVTATVKDDGRGFDVPTIDREVLRTNHLGLISMRERASLIGALIDVSSSAGRGTQIRVSLTT